MSFTIRPMKESDVDDVYTIETNVHIAPWGKEIIRDCVLVGYDCRVLEFIDETNRILIGYIIIRQSNTMAHILNLCIAKEYQSKGYGRKLLQTVLDSLTNHDGVVLEVRPSNSAALHLYQSMGFHQDQIKKDYYKDGERCEDAIFLRKNIKN